MADYIEKWKIKTYHYLEKIKFCNTREQIIQKLHGMY